jgi:hypothetical protein
MLAVPPGAVHEGLGDRVCAPPAGTPRLILVSGGGLDAPGSPSLFGFPGGGFAPSSVPVFA